MRSARACVCRVLVRARALGAATPPIFCSPSPPPPSPSSVNVTFVNYAGERTRLPGRVGDTLLDVATRYQYKFVDGACHGGGDPVDLLHKEGNWAEPNYGEGAFCYMCHVIIPKSHYAMLPAKRPDETLQLEAYPFKEDVAET